MNRVLSKGPLAVIHQQEICACLNITLPHINLHLSEEIFRQWTEEVRKRFQQSCDCYEEDALLIIPTPMEGAHLHFRRNEARVLLKTLYRARTVLDMNKIPKQHTWCKN